ncbi:MAG: ferrous iron transport protein B [Pirellulaceae bacterium]
MSKQRREKCYSVAVLGNPNTGKSTLFNALTGSSQRTGNYPGVTVERRVGRIAVDEVEFELTDLPGTYSLSPRSPDELVAVQFLIGTEVVNRPPDALLCVVDASNLRRNLFIVSQLLDLGLPAVVALNMTDVAERRGLEIDVEKLSEHLGAEVIPVRANRSVGLPALKNALIRAIQKPRADRHNPFPAPIALSVDRLKEICPDSCSLKQFVVTRMLFDGDGLVTDRLTKLVDQRFLESLPEEKRQILAEGDITIGEHESRARYNWISDVCDQCVHQVNPDRRSLSERVDDWLTHPVFGALIAILAMSVLFFLVFLLADPASALIDWAKSGIGWGIQQIVPDGMFQSLLVDGLIEGVGGVLVFLPQIMLLFLLLGILEDSGYLARASFLMDTFMSRIGLSGIALIPLLSSFACAIPGVMATRVIRDPRERLITILIAPLMSCSARLPVYVLLVAAFIANPFLRVLTMLIMYLIGIVVAVIVAWLIRRFVFREPSSEFLMELPAYKLPQPSSVIRRMLEGGWAFVRDAGTLIVAVTILVWAAAYFPHNNSNLPAGFEEQLTRLQQQIDEPNASAESIANAQEQLLVLEAQQATSQMNNSYLARIGRTLEPIVKPLGWDWRVGSAVVASFPAREVVVSTMGVIFGLSDDADEESESLRTKLREATWSGSDRKLFTLPMALGLMVFFALCAQCVSTLAVIKRETRSWRWPIVTFAYMTSLAYVGALVTYQVGTWIESF